MQQRAKNLVLNLFFMFSLIFSSQTLAAHQNGESYLDNKNPNINIVSSQVEQLNQGENPQSMDGEGISQNRRRPFWRDSLSWQNVRLSLRNLPLMFFSPYTNSGLLYSTGRFKNRSAGLSRLVAELGQDYKSNPYYSADKENSWNDLYLNSIASAQSNNIITVGMMSADILNLDIIDRIQFMLRDAGIYEDGDLQALFNNHQYAGALSEGVEKLAQSFTETGSLLTRDNFQVLVDNAKDAREIASAVVTLQRGGVLTTSNIQLLANLGAEYIEHTAEILVKSAQKKRHESDQSQPAREKNQKEKFQADLQKKSQAKSNEQQERNNQEEAKDYELPRAVLEERRSSHSPLNNSTPTNIETSASPKNDNVYKTSRSPSPRQNPSPNSRENLTSSSVSNFAYTQACSPASEVDFDPASSQDFVDIPNFYHSNQYDKSDNSQYLSSSQESNNFENYNQMLNEASSKDIEKHVNRLSRTVDSRLAIVNSSIHDKDLKELIINFLTLLNEKVDETIVFMQHKEKAEVFRETMLIYLRQIQIMFSKERLKIVDQLAKYRTQCELTSDYDCFNLELDQELTRATIKDVVRHFRAPFQVTMDELRQEVLENELKNALSEIKERFKEIHNGQNNSPTCFLSYAWGHYGHVKRVQSLDRHLRAAGLTVHFDDRNKFGSLSSFIDHINTDNYVLVVGTPEYRTKYEDEGGGHVVGTEFQMIQARFTRNASAIVKILLSGIHGDEEKNGKITILGSFPPVIGSGFIGTDFTNQDKYYEKLFEVIKKLYELQPEILPEIEDIEKGFSKKKEEINEARTQEDVKWISGLWNKRDVALDDAKSVTPEESLGYTVGGWASQTKLSLIQKLSDQNMFQDIKGDDEKDEKDVEVADIEEVVEVREATEVEEIAAVVKPEPVTTGSVTKEKDSERAELDSTDFKESERKKEIEASDDRVVAIFDPSVDAELDRTGNKQELTNDNEGDGRDSDLVKGQKAEISRIVEQGSREVKYFLQSILLFKPGKVPLEILEYVLSMEFGWEDSEVENKFKDILDEFSQSSILEVSSNLVGEKAEENLVVKLGKETAKEFADENESDKISKQFATYFISSKKPNLHLVSMYAFIAMMDLHEAEKILLKMVNLLVDIGIDIDKPDKNGLTALIMASINGHTEVVKLLLANGAEIDKAQEDGWTALMCASLKGHKDVVKLLLDKRAKIDKAEEGGITAFLFASQAGHLDVVKLLLDKGVGINETDKKGVTALMLASESGHLDVVKLLLDKRAEIDKAQEDGWTALMCASLKGHKDVVGLLLDKRATIYKADKDGDTAFLFASQEGHLDVVKLLLDKGVGINETNKKGVTALMLASQEGHLEVVRSLLGKAVEINKVSNGCTALILASINGHTKVVKLLLDNCAAEDKADNDGRTALMLASQNGRTGVVKLLIDKKVRINKTNQEGMTALMLASQNGHTEVVKLLLGKGVTIDKADKDGWTALMFASRNGHTEVVKLLLDRGVEADKASKEGVTALMLASIQGHTKVVELLLVNSDSEGIEEVNKGDSTPLMCASQEGHTEVVKLLLANKAKVDKANKEGVTALMLASQNGHTEVVKLLLANKAKVDKANKEGVTALMLASQNGHTDVVKLLLDNDATIGKASKKGMTALIYASMQGHDEVVDLLINGGAKVNEATGKDGATALMMASQNGHKDVVKLLIANSANIDKADEDGWTALMYASLAGNTEVMNSLLDEGANPKKKNKKGKSALRIAKDENHVEIVELLKNAAPSKSFLKRFKK